MYHYVIILGREAALAAAEVIASGIFTKFDINCSSNQWLLGTGPQTADEIKPLLNKLGGTIKIAEVIKTYPQPLELITARDIQPLIKPVPGKINFGFSVYYDDRANNKTTNLEKLGKNLKGLLVNKGQPCRFVTSQHNPLSSVIVKTQKLISVRGYEFCFMVYPKQTIVAKTFTVQDFIGYGRRDFGRPKRDLKQGLLPPKLAQILLNLARVKTGDTVLDPFCGNGTILQEALLLGAGQVIGRDLNPQAVTKTQQNLNWLKDQLPFTGQWSVYQHDALLPDPKLKMNGIDAVVTEPWLGPIHPPQNTAQQQQLIKELVNLYRQALTNLEPLLKTGGYVSMIVPIIGNFPSANQLLPVKNLQPVPLLPTALANLFKVNNAILTYRRPDQLVGREIIVFTKPTA